MEMKIRLLVVDDQPHVADLVVHWFLRLGYEVESAESGEQALIMMADKKFDIVISDIMMPEMSGIDLLRRIRAEYPMVHVIMFTGYTQMENILASMRLGARGCIFKNEDEMTHLEEAVQRSVDDIQRWIDILKRLAGKHWEKTLGDS